jgi:hypothetical protein
MATKKAGKPIKKAKKLGNVKTLKRKELLRDFKMLKRGGPASIL